MSKRKTIFVCQNCGAQSPKWIGKCSQCNEWNTFAQELIYNGPKHKSFSINKKKNIPTLISEISLSKNKRICFNNNEFNRVLGGGLLPGSIVLIGGEPGIGKSTLALQVSLNITDFKTLYISGEESEQQIKLRADRIGGNSENCYILSETLLENIFSHIEKLKPDIIIIDSIQTLHSENIESSPGSVSQIRGCTTDLLKFAKESSIPVILIGHINKDGNIAGPKILEHIVDTVIQFEGDTNYMYRILRATKNRFGSTSELGIFEMCDSGLKEVSNPSELLISQQNENLSGSSIAATINGIRPFLIEVQALVSSAAYGTPQRSSTGFDLRRLNMLLAVLEKRAGFKIATKDVFLNIAGGIKVDDPAIDMAVICAILSSSIDIAVNKNICFAGEVGLSGEIRPVNRIAQRIKEAEKLGFKKIFVSEYNNKSIPSTRDSKYKIEIKFVNQVENIFKYLFR